MKQKKIITLLITIFIFLSVLLAFIIWKNIEPEMTDSDKIAVVATSVETAPTQEETSGAETEATTLARTSYNMFFAGDILLDNSGIINLYDSKGINGIIASDLQADMVNADICMANNEFSFSTRGTPMEDKQFTFRVNPSYVKVLNELGLDIVSLANNHALDYGKDALSDTFDTLDKAGIFYSGAGADRQRASKAYYKDLGDTKVGILSASRVIPVAGWNIDIDSPGMLCTYGTEAILKAIKETKQSCDYLVVYVHWGVERMELPEDYQHSLAKKYIDAGADLVVGTHPHVPQGIEYYNGKPIIYSLGNYIFNINMPSAYAINVMLNSEGAPSVQVIPVTSNNCHLHKSEGSDKKSKLKYLESISFDVKIDADGYISPK